MQELTIIALTLITIYLLIGAFFFFYQRKLIYYPTGVDPDFSADEIKLTSQGHELRGWVLHPGKSQAVIYFGGNSELVTHREQFFDDVFADYSVYIVNYRGYGNSEGFPSERALFADALALYDRIAPDHESVMAYGRSLGSGVAAYLAARRPLERVILLTPYDSVERVAQRMYPIFPVRFFLKDHFDSAALAQDIDMPVLIATAELDRVIPLQHSLRLRERFDPQQLRYAMIRGAAHNDIVDFADYRQLVSDFIAS
ncbi:MAG: alpha/beta hydrolase [Gammaproteobacteria bacterium]|nr:alpha/beta hydrolase [Gammaproteobacteria bacterium]